MNAARWLLMALIAVAATPVTAETLTVSPQGRDTWSGKQAEPNAARSDGPLATLNGARNAIRGMKAAGGLKAPVTVEVRAGTYFLAEPFTLGPEDSGTQECPITYRAWPGEKVVLSAGRRIEGWKTQDGKRYTVTLPEVREGTWHFRQLRVGDERQTRARTPNADPSRPGIGGYFLVPGYSGSGSGEFGYGMGGLQGEGTWLEYPFEAPAGGDYLLCVRYANNGATNQRFFGFTDMSGRTRVRVDGGDPVTIPDMGDTGSFYAGFRWTQSVTLHLATGKHTLRWENPKGGALSLDAFALTNDPDYVPEIEDLARLKPPATGKHLVLIHAECYAAGKGANNMEAQLQEKDAHGRKTTLRFEPGTLKPMPASPDVEIFLIPEWDWVSELVRLESIDMERRVATLSGANCLKGIFPGNRFTVENALEALDTPGEWCLNRRAGVVTLWPKRPDFEKEGVVAPRFDRAIELRGEPGKPVSWVSLEGFTITDTGFTAPETITDVYFPADAAVWLDGAEHCRVVRCEMRDVGGYGVCLTGPSRENEILGNLVVGAGQGGVYLKGIAEEVRKPFPKERRPSGNLVEGNHIHHCGLFYRHVGGVYLAFSHGNAIRHNLVHDVPRYGISLKNDSGGNVVEFNEVRRTNLETQDTGAIEMAENRAGSIVRNNLVVDAVGCGFDRGANRVAAPYNACGIYLDNHSSKCLVTHNVVVRSAGGVWLNAGSHNVMENNVFVDGKGRQAVFNLKFGAVAEGNVWRRNIIAWSDASAPAWALSGWSPGDTGIASDYNLLHVPGGKPILTGVEGAPGDSFDTWRKAGNDTHSQVADALFVDPARGDYRLKPGSPAFALGFEAIDLSRVGLKGARVPATR